MKGSKANLYESRNTNHAVTAHSGPARPHDNEASRTAEVRGSFPMLLHLAGIKAIIQQKQIIIN